MKNIIVTLFGGCGFIGAEIVRVLAKQGYMIHLAEKHPKRADMLKFNGDVGQITGIACDYSAKGIEDAVKGSSIVINCTGILLEKPGRSFMQTHAYLPEIIAKACKKQGVSQFVHISALGCDSSISDYGKSKYAGEKLVQKAFDTVTILRPSIVFGPKDRFFNMFAGMARVMPFLPLIGGGKTLFQPVYVGDVAQAVSKAISKKAFGVYELGGPQVMSFRQMLETMKHHTGQSVMLLSVPFTMARIKAFFLSILPNPPITADQIKSLRHDTIVGKHAQTLTDLDVNATHMDMILPAYLGRFKG